MRKARKLIGVASGAWLALGVACSNGASSPPSAANGVLPPPAASEPTPPATQPPAEEASAAGSAAPSVPSRTPSPAAPDAPRAPDAPADTPAAEPQSGLPVGPSLPVDPDTTPIMRHVPTDSRAVQLAPAAPPISGGTLVVTPDNFLAVAADPDRDRVSIVDLWTQRVAASIALEPGDEPGRIALDNAGRAHVALRRGGAVVSIDLLGQRVVERREVCAAPRGIAHDASRKTLVVACQSGEVVTLPVSGTDGIVKKQLGSDLRDVMPSASGAFVTRLKTAELISLDANASQVAVAKPNVRQQFFPESDGSHTVDTLAPLGARRTIDTGDGFTMLHAGARNGDIPVKPDNSLGGGSPYGGAGQCGGVVGTAITRFDKDGKVVATAQVMGTLAVDIAHSRATGEYAIALAGAIDPNQPLSDFNKPVVPPQAVDPQTGAATVFTTAAILRYDPAVSGDLKDPNVQPCVPVSDIVGLPGPATSVAYLADGRLLAQTRQPAAVFVIAPANQFGIAHVQIDLGGSSVLDTGHEIFHRDAGAGVACASCHIEGGDDGHVWNFVDMGPRRTQSISVGLEGTEPFHWIGDMRDLPTLVDHVFVGRMGGVHQTPERINALAKWMFGVKAPRAIRPVSDPAVERGKALFVGEAECGECHNGPKLTNNKTVDVGTGLDLQVPSLVAIAYRGPWIHDGCAKTLHDRFKADCGGAAHGKTAQLSAVQIDDLVAYLESL